MRKGQGRQHCVSGYGQKDQCEETVEARGKRASALEMKGGYSQESEGVSQTVSKDRHQKTYQHGFDPCLNMEAQGLRCVSDAKGENLEAGGRDVG